jgi:hypothetical protein
MTSFARVRFSSARRALIIEPCIEVRSAEAPLATHPNRGNFPGLDQPVDRTEVDVQILEDLFGRQKHVVCRAIQGHVSDRGVLYTIVQLFQP